MTGIIQPARTPMELLRLLVMGTMGDAVEPPKKLSAKPDGLIQDLSNVQRSDAFKRGRAVGTRPWSKVVGLCFHQTASGHLDADHPQLLSVPAHIMLHRSGAWTLLHPLNAYVQHGHALNGGTIGIEVDARAAGVEGDPSTFWRSGTEKDLAKSYSELVREATPAQLAAIPDIMLWCCSEVAANGGRIRGMWGHIQGHKSRGGDPGSRIWKAVEEAQHSSAMAAFDLVDVRDKTLGSGKPIPAEWRLL